MSPGVEHPASDIGFHLGQLLSWATVVFLFRKPHLVASRDKADTPDTGIDTFTDIRQGIAHLHDLLDGRDTEVYHVLENHIRSGTAGRERVGRNEVVHPVPLGFSAGTDDIHHRAGVARSRTNPDTLGTQAFERLHDTGDRVGKLRQRGEEVLFETLIHLVHVLLVPHPMVAGGELLGYIRHREDGADMVDFEHTHRLAGLTEGDFNALFFFEYF